MRRAAAIDRVFALATAGAPGTEALLDGLTQPWLDDAEQVAESRLSPRGPAA